MIYNLRKFRGSEVAKQRLKIIKFYDQYGEKAALQAFGADRKVISRWKIRLRNKDGKLEALIPLSTRPHKVRISQVPLKVIEFISHWRKRYPKIGKGRIKILLDPFCRQQKLKTISASTIGNIIERHHLFFPPADKVFNLSDYTRPRRKKQLRYSPTPQTAVFSSLITV